MRPYLVGRPDIAALGRKAYMGFALVFEWLGFETGLCFGGTKMKWNLIKLEFVILTVGIKFQIGIGGGVRSFVDT